MTIRVGIVGTGAMANAHAENFLKISGVSVGACFDVVEERSRAFADKHGIRHVATSLADLLKRVDAVTLVTPDRVHREGALEVLAKKKHLLCEKPLTVTLSEAREVATAYLKARKKGVIGMVNFSYRRSAALQRAIELAQEGALGELRHAHAFYLQSWLASPIWGQWTDEMWLWRLQTAAGSGGVLGDIGCHLLDMATSVTGPVRQLRCWLKTFPKVTPDGTAYKKWEGKKLDANDTAIIELELESGGTLVVHTTRWAMGHSNHLRFEAHGTRGALRFDLDESYDKLGVCVGEDTVKAEWKTLTLESTPNNYERFVRSIEKGEVDQPDILRGAEVQAYLDACERSAKTGKWVKIRDYR
jgi:predicted dehydrogenase